MKCFFHQQADAAALCKGCGRALCAACGDRFTLLRCELCIVRLNKHVAGEHAKRLCYTALLYVGGAGLLQQSLVGAPLVNAVSAMAVGALAFPMAYWGWRFLSRFSPGLFLVSIPLWLILIVAKLLLSTVVGVVAAPLGIITSVRELLIIQRTGRAIHGREI